MSTAACGLGKSIERLEKPLESLKRAGEGAFAFLLGESLVEKGKEALEFAGNIQFMANQVGVSTKFLQESGSPRAVRCRDRCHDTSLIKFSRSVGEAANGNKAIVELFDKLGVKVLDAGGKVRSVESVYADTATA